MTDEPADDQELALWLHVQAGEFDRAYAVATRLLIMSAEIGRAHV